MSQIFHAESDWFDKKGNPFLKINEENNILNIASERIVKLANPYTLKHFSLKVKDIQYIQKMWF